MWRCAAVCAVVLLALLYLHLDDCAARSLQKHLLICTVCSYDGVQAAAPITFAAVFHKDTFVTQAEPLAEPQEGRYAYKKTGARLGVVQLRQSEKDVLSTLRLRFVHRSAGTLFGKIYQGDELVARQYGTFHLCPLPDSNVE